MNVETLWDECFLEAIGEQEQKTGTNPVDWRAGGRASKAWPEKENKLWWDTNGKEMVATFIEAWRDSNFTIWTTPEGVPGIEIGFNNYFGIVPVKAFADAVVVTKYGELAVIDFKTGSHVPDSAFQLGVYACLMEKQFGVRPSLGFFYNARAGKFEEAYGLDRWTIPMLTELFTKFDTAVRSEIFLPNIGMACSTCGVKDYCYAVGGQLSQVYDPLTKIAKGESNG